MALLDRLLPESLTNRVFALYGITLLMFVVVGTGSYLVRELEQEIEQPQTASVMMIEVMAQAVQDSVVIGDYDTVRKTLDKGVQGSLFATASFLDLQGGRIVAESRTRSASYSPDWLQAWVQDRLLDVNRSMSVGGKDYGVLRLQFDARAVAVDIWSMAITALALALVSMAAGLMVIRFALGRWLGSLERLRGMVEDLGNGRLDAATLDAHNAPTEIRRVVEMFNQTASLVRERESTRRALDDQKFALDQHAIVSITDPAGNITYANDRFCEISGYTREALLGQNHRLISSGAHDREFFGNMWATITQGRVWHGEICNRNRKGGLYWVNATLVPLKGEDGHISQYIAIRTDITARKEAERAMLEAKEAAEKASRVKSDFLANMSHEIRTPMNGVIGMTELVLDTDLNAEQRDYLGTVKSSADALLQIVNDILDFSKVEAGLLRLETIEFPLEETLRDTLRPLAMRGHQKNLEVLLRVGAGVPDRVVGDPGRLRQIIVNLVGNAIKFTEAGEIEVAVRLAPEQTGPDPAINFSVRDTGIGIAEEKRKSIFESFSQADTSTTRQYGGTGLGLTISAQLVALMGGQIDLRSAPGAGSTFSFTLSMPRGSQPDQAAFHSAGRLHGLKVLVVDDNPSNGEWLLEMLQVWSMQATLAASGEQALDAVDQAAARGQGFDMCIIDAHMPGMDGFALAARLREHKQHAGPLIMLLAPDRQREDIARCEAMGMAAGVAKPVAQAELFTALLRALGETVAMVSRPDRRHSPRAPQRRLRILVAEDNPVNQTLALRLLEKLGHSVQLAHNGIEAVRHWMDGEFDAILMDVDMPLMNGLDAARRIREEEQAEAVGSHVPIIAMTAHAMEGARDNCLRHGMDGYLAKPIVTDDLWHELDRIAHGPLRSTPAQAPPAMTAGTGAAPKDWDVSRMRAGMGDDAALFSELRVQFLHDAPVLLAQAREALLRGDGKALREAAHALKGMTAVFAADATMEASARLEKSAGKDGAADDLRALEARLQSLIETVGGYQW